MSRRRAHHPHEEEHENAERWLVSYADMITLLAALFIVLFAMSRLDLAKFQKFAGALNSSLGGGTAASQKPSVLDGSGDKPTQGGTGMLDGTSAQSKSQSSAAAATDTPNPDQSFDQQLADKLSATSATGKVRQELTQIQQQISAEPRRGRPRRGRVVPPRRPRARRADRQRPRAVRVRLRRRCATRARRSSTGWPRRSRPRTTASRSTATPTPARSTAPSIRRTTHSRSRGRRACCGSSSTATASPARGSRRSDSPTSTRSPRTTPRRDGPRTGGSRS